MEFWDFPNWYCDQHKTDQCSLVILYYKWSMINKYWSLLWVSIKFLLLSQALRSDNRQPVMPKSKKSFFHSGPAVLHQTWNFFCKYKKKFLIFAVIWPAVCPVRAVVVVSDKTFVRFVFQSVFLILCFAIETQCHQSFLFVLFGDTSSSYFFIFNRSQVPSMVLVTAQIIQVEWIQILLIVLIVGETVEATAITAMIETNYNEISHSNSSNNRNNGNSNGNPRKNRRSKSKRKHQVTETFDIVNDPRSHQFSCTHDVQPSHHSFWEW